MTHHSLDFANMVRTQGYRMTPQRQLVLDAVCEGGGHTTVDEICQRVQAKAPSVNRSTIYRTLYFLQGLHLVVAAEIGGHTVYEIAHAEPHHHLVCYGCGTEIELHQDLLEPAFASIRAETGFNIRTDHLVFAGLCKACTSQESG